MKILKIQGANLASLKEFSIDLEKGVLGSSGLFAITGETGSGKSTLLDAMCLALYHKVPRLENVGVQNLKFESLLGEVNQNDLSHLIRRGAGFGYAEVKFVGSDYKKYTSHWGFRKAKQKGRKPQLVVWVRDEATQEILVDRVKESEEFLEKKIGLNFNEFTRTVFLSQGQFSAFVKTNKEDERAKILEQITGAHFYSRIGATIAERRKKEEEIYKSLTLQKGTLEVLSDEERNELARAQSTLEKRSIPLQTSISLCTQMRTLQERKTKLGEEQKKTLANQQQAREKETQFVEKESKLHTKYEAFLLEQKELRSQFETVSQLDTEIEFTQKEHFEIKASKEKLKISTLQKEKQLTAKNKELDLLSAELEKNEIWFAEQSHWKEKIQGWESAEGKLENYLHLDLGIKQKVEELSAVQKKQGPLLEKKGTFEKRLQEESPTEGLETLFEKKREAQFQFDFLRYCQQEDENQKEQALLREALANFALQIPALEHGAKKAQEKYDLSKTLTERSVLLLRKNLRPGESCPVCGSLEHPNAHLIEEDLKRALQEDQLEFENLQKELAKQKEAQQKAELKVQSLEKELQTLQNQKQNLEIHSEEIQKLNQLEEVQKFQKEIEGKIQKHRAMEQLKTELNGLIFTLNDLENKATHLEKSLSENREQIQRFTQELNHFFGALPWETQIQNGGKRWVQSCKTHVQNWRNKQELSESFRKKTGTLESEIQILLPLIKEEEMEQTKLQQKHHEVAEKLTLLTGKRITYFAGKEIQLVKKELEQNELFFQSSLKLLAEEKQQQISEKSRLEALLHTFEKESLDQREEETKLLSLWEDISKNWESPSQTSMETLQETPLQLQEKLEQNLRSIQQELGSLKRKILQDKENTEKLTGLLVELKKQETTLHHWSQLNDLLGVGQGAAFRKIAQQYSLELLLEAANEQLKQITPRYSLQKQGDSLHFVVIDQEHFGSSRPIHTLSGGETFIVSLALALALSKLSSGNVLLESLFIDEGFGTLDTQTLRQVMKALDSLQSQGRQIGIITHVQELKENIPIRIEVIKKGQGTSEVLLP